MSSKPLISSLVIPFDTASGGASLDLSSIRLPISVVESSPISVARDTGREEADKTVLILESMKMEIEVKAGNDGSVASIDVTKGQNVEEGQAIFTLK